MIPKPDPKLKEHWESILSEAGLSMHAGIHEHREHGKLVLNLVHAGNGTDLEILHKMTLIEAQGRVTPEGAGPDEHREED